MPFGLQLVTERHLHQPQLRCGSGGWCPFVGFLEKRQRPIVMVGTTQLDTAADQLFNLRRLRVLGSTRHRTTEQSQHREHLDKKSSHWILPPQSDGKSQTSTGVDVVSSHETSSAKPVKLLRSWSQCAPAIP